MKLLNTIELNNETRKIYYKAMEGVGAKQLHKCVGQTLKLCDVLMSESEQVDEEGNPKVLVCLIDDKGDVYQSLSPSLYKSVLNVDKYYDIPNEQPEVLVVTGMSNSGREFLMLQIV